MKPRRIVNKKVTAKRAKPKVNLIEIVYNKPEEPQIIKIMPFRGLNEELIEGEKTTINLYKDYLEYKIKGTQEVTISPAENSLINKEEKKTNFYFQEEGIIDKSFIGSITKYIETNYDEDMDPYKVNYIDIVSSGDKISVSCDNEESKNKVYEQLINWKFKNK